MEKINLPDYCWIINWLYGAISDNVNNRLFYNGLFNARFI
jgi:hypothetical protein